MPNSRVDDDKTMSVLDHISELRTRLLVSMIVFVVLFVVAMVFYAPLIKLITVQFSSLTDTEGHSMFVHTVAEGFVIQLQTSALMALIVSLPVHVINFVQFIFPGIDKKYRRIVTVALVASFLLAVFGAWIAYFQIVPFSIRFLTNAAFIPDGVGVLLNYGQSTQFVLSFLLWSIITFQTPLVLEILLILNVLNRKKVFKASRFVIVIIFVIAAIVTPSVDPVSQLAIAVPLIILYFLVILVAKIFRFGEQ